MTHRVQDWMNFGDIQEIRGRYWDIYGIDVYPKAEGVMISLEEGVEEDVEVVVTNEYLRDLERHERMLIDEYLEVRDEDDEYDEDEEEDH